MGMNRTLSILSAGVFAAFLSVAAIAQQAPPAQPVDLTPQFRSAALAITNLEVFEIGGIVVIRGRAADRDTAQQAGVIVQSAGYSRVANLVQVAAAPDDALLRRQAERELALHRSLDGCKFRVDAKDGIVHVAGTVAQDMQKDEVIAVLRTINGVRDVQTDLQR